MSKEITRRDFLGITAVTAAVSVLAGCNKPVEASSGAPKQDIPTGEIDFSSYKNFKPEEIHTQCVDTVVEIYDDKGEYDKGFTTKKLVSGNFQTGDNCRRGDPTLPASNGSTCKILVRPIEDCNQ